MDQKKCKSFPSKILLFGEYIVLHGASALAIPYPKYAMNKSEEVYKNNREFYRKLERYILEKEIFQNRVSSKFNEDINLGLHYDSNIPVGYGLGSSGALVAAIYDEYFKNKPTDFKEIQNELSEIESYFHEKSSGIDPLTSYLQQLILSQNNTIQILDTIKIENFELVDSGKRRNAKEAVKHFNQLNVDKKFVNKLTELKLISEEIIQLLIFGKNFNSELKKYSIIQLDIFSDFIPTHIQEEWTDGLNSDEYYMKLCGAGMGGMYLKFENQFNQN